MLLAFITGITGQDGSYLAELLLSKEYTIHCLVRPTSNIDTSPIKYILKNPNVIIHYGDLTNNNCLCNILSNIKLKYPNITRLEIYNLAAQSNVKVSFEMPEYTAEIDALGTLKLIEAIRYNNLENVSRFFQASTSELYGKIQVIPQSETTPFYPRNPYGVAKLFSFWIVKNYRETYNMYACNGILFNHESERRGHNFVTRKITIGLGKILNGKMDTLEMGNINSLRDWGHAQDYVEGMWKILQADKPDDFVLATGKMHTIREFIEIAFKLKGFDIKWKGFGVNEIGYDSITGRELIKINPKYYRPDEVEQLLGDATKAKKILNWEPKIHFLELVKRMVDNDCK